jgi:hypothetical protein
VRWAIIIVVSRMSHGHLRIVVAALLNIQVSALRAADPTTATPIIVLAGGDDGLTQGLRYAIETASKSSADLRLVAAGLEPGTLILRIPTNVPWKKVGGRVRALYTIEFSSANGLNWTADARVLGTSKGSCWEDRLEVCAAQIIKDARGIARRMR